MGKENRGPFGFDELTSTLATTSAGSRSDHPHIAYIELHRREATVQQCVGELVEDTGVFRGGAFDQIQLLGAGHRRVSQSVQHARPTHRAAATERLCGAAVELSDADVDGGEVTGEASSSSLETPRKPEQPPQSRRCSRLR